MAGFGKTLEQSRDGDTLQARFLRACQASEQLCAPLQIEDYGLQAMPEVSPVKWHLAHTAWYFETFVLAVADADYQSPWPQYRHLFNSYYNGIGVQYPRARRGLLSRPTVAEVFRYRHEIRQRLETLLQSGNAGEELQQRIELGIQHEQQHQELMLTDLKYCLSLNPLRPAYAGHSGCAVVAAPGTWDWLDYPAGEVLIGHDGQQFCFDNERPRHRVLLAPFRLASRLVSNHEYLEFIDDGGYQRPELWLSDGWAERQAAGWEMPLYWEQQGAEWAHFTLHGMQPLPLQAPLAHVSYYEADAYARWCGARLPTEAEWECAAGDCPVEGNFRETGRLAPVPAVATGAGAQQMFGDAWEWTASSYSPYPGFVPMRGELGEYNGKFMCNQFVLRGGSCVSPQDHLRASYRNFFYPRDRWQFSGIRLALSPPDAPRRGGRQ